MSIPTDRRLPRYHQLRDQLAAKITARDWRPGDLIPSESVLAVDYGVAVGTVRKAIDQLVADRVLERQQGRGTFVKHVRFTSSMFRFFRFQSEDGDRRVPTSRILHRAVLPAPAGVAAVLRLPVDEPLIHLSRLRLIDDAPLLGEEIWLQKSRFEAINDLAPEAFGDLLYPIYEELCGQSVVSAEETLTVAEADPAIARLLHLQSGDPIIVIDRIAFNLSQQPIEWRRSRGPANRFRYQVDIR